VTVLWRTPGAGHRRRIGIGIEAAILAQPDQRGHPHPLQIEGQLHRVVAGVEDKERHRLAGRQPGEQGLNLARRRRVDLRGAGNALHVQGAVQLSRRKPSWLIHCYDHPATTGTPPLWREE
jgi:hypothetical protein